MSNIYLGYKIKKYQKSKKEEKMWW